MVHFRNKTSLAQVVAERRNVVQEKYTGRGASTRTLVQKNGDMTFFLWMGGATQVTKILKTSVVSTTDGCQPRYFL